MHASTLRIVEPAAASLYVVQRATSSDAEAEGGSFRAYEDEMCADDARN